MYPEIGNKFRDGSVSLVVETLWFQTNRLEKENPKLWRTVNQVFGLPNEHTSVIENRIREHLPNFRTIFWEGDPQTFQFSYVSPSAEDILGYPCRLWLSDPSFWTEKVVHDSDRSDAVAFCALATGMKEDHDFRYRARSVDGRTLWLHDVVKVVIGAKGVPIKLRGLMIDVTNEVSSTREPEFDRRAV